MSIPFLSFQISYIIAINVTIIFTYPKDSAPCFNLSISSTEEPIRGRVTEFKLLCHFSKRFGSDVTDEIIMSQYDARLKIAYGRNSTVLVISGLYGYATRRLHCS